MAHPVALLIFMAMKRALITGITGQDGSYLAELLLEKNYEVYGFVRRVALEEPEHRLSRLLPVLHRLNLRSGSVDSYASVHEVVADIKPDECYHLAAQSFVSYSFDDQFSTLNANINGTHFILAALRRLAPECRFYLAGSSEMFGQADQVPQNETTRFQPRSFLWHQQALPPFTSRATIANSYKMHASGGIIFNHESPRRGYEFVTRKITSGVARILSGRAKDLTLGNLEPPNAIGATPANTFKQCG